MTDEVELAEMSTNPKAWKAHFLDDEHEHCWLALRAFKKSVEPRNCPDPAIRVAVEFIMVKVVCSPVSWKAPCAKW
eukprot:666888-Amorphochlora_amoeboformis.AAC.1